MFYLLFDRMSLLAAWAKRIHRYFGFRGGDISFFDTYGKQIAPMG